MAEPARQIDRIDAAPRFTAADAARLNAMFAGVDTADMLTTIFQQNLLGHTAVVSSFGAESAVLLHLLAAVDPAVTVLFLDTGKHFPETLAYRDSLVAHLGLTDLRIISPAPSMLAEQDETGLRWSYDPDGCCEIRKVVPLEQALEGFDSSITGRKNFQSATRAGLPRFEPDGDRLKFNPLADWDKARIEAYFRLHDLPPHPLVEQGYPSIGCAPCTSRVLPGEDPRAGRWRGWDKLECGIHNAAASDNLSDDPVF